MATASVELVVALRRTAIRLRTGVKYSWSLMGSCNCGHLAQTITGLSSKDIQSRALERSGDWTEQTETYCSSSGLSLDDIFNAMLQVGMSKDDIKHLEQLSDPTVLDTLGLARKGLEKNVRENVITYMEAMASHLESQLLNTLPLPRDKSQIEILNA